jgi:hypothetical protein
MAKARKSKQKKMGVARKGLVKKAVKRLAQSKVVKKVSKCYKKSVTNQFRLISIRKQMVTIGFEDLTHRVLPGHKFGGFQGRILEQLDGKNKVKVELLKNVRGNFLQRPKEIEISLDQLEATCSDDMLATLETEGQDEEDSAFLKWEQKFWKCPKCGSEVRNDNGYCPKKINGKDCMGTKVPEKPLSWDGCFSTVQAATVSLCFQM